MYALYSCFLHNETAALINADIPGEAAQTFISATPGPGMLSLLRNPRWDSHTLRIFQPAIYFALCLAKQR